MKYIKSLVLVFIVSFFVISCENESYDTTDITNEIAVTSNENKELFQLIKANLGLVEAQQKDPSIDVSWRGFNYQVWGQSISFTKDPKKPGTNEDPSNPEIINDPRFEKENDKIIRFTCSVVLRGEGQQIIHTPVTMEGEIIGNLTSIVKGYRLDRRVGYKYTDYRYYTEDYLNARISDPSQIDDFLRIKQILKNNIINDSTSDGVILEHGEGNNGGGGNVNGDAPVEDCTFTSYERCYNIMICEGYGCPGDPNSTDAVYEEVCIVDYYSTCTSTVQGDSSGGGGSRGGFIPTDILSENIATATLGSYLNYLLDRANLNGWDELSWFQNLFEYHTTIDAFGNIVFTKSLKEGTEECQDLIEGMFLFAQYGGLPGAVMSSLIGATLTTESDESCSESGAGFTSAAQCLMALSDAEMESITPSSGSTNAPGGLSVSDPTGSDEPSDQEQLDELIQDLLNDPEGCGGLENNFSTKPGGKKIENLDQKIQDCFGMPNEQGEYIDCSELGPDDSFEITLYVDQPVPGERDVFTLSGVGFDYDVGHTFVNVTSNVNNNESSLTFGYYPEDGTEFNGEVPQAIFDDSNHSFEVSITFTISCEEFNSALEQSVNSASGPYHTQAYNCSDYGIEVMDAAGIDIPDTERVWDEVPNIGALNSEGFGTNPGDLGEDLRGLVGDTNGEINYGDGILDKPKNTNCGN